MNTVDLLNDVRNSFGGLWHSKERGNSIEIITPYVTTNNKFVSIFVTIQDDCYFITDGGWISSGYYDTFLNTNDNYFLKLFDYYQNSFNVLQVLSQGNTFYYLKAHTLIDVPSKILALSTFIQSVISASEIVFEDIKEAESRKRFFSQANTYMKSIFPKDLLKIGGYLYEERKDLKFNVIYNKTPNSITLINYITGSNPNNFSNSICKTNTLFEMASKSNLSNYISNKLAIIDTLAEGFEPNKVGGFLMHLENNSDSKIINWHEKEQIKLYI